MMKRRRKFLLRVLEILAAALVLLDAILLLGVWQPLERRETSMGHQLAGARRRVQELQTQVASLERFRDNFPVAQEQLAAFKRDHVPSRRQGFSRAARLIRNLSNQAGAEVVGVSYRLDSDRDEPLLKLGVEVNLEGSYSTLLKFTHALETASDMIVLRDFTVGAMDSGRLAMRLGADLYLVP